MLGGWISGGWDAVKGAVAKLSADAQKAIKGAQDFAKKAEFTLKLHKAFPQDGWAREGATLETETQRNERRWNKFVMLMAGLTIACPVIVLIIGRGILWINEGFKRVSASE